MHYDLTTGNIVKKMLLFAVPLMIGNILQQLYNIVDTLIVGRVLGEHALAAVGSSYTLMTFLTSILIGLCMGSGAFFSIQFGRKDEQKMKQAFFLSFLAIGGVTVFLNAMAFLCLDWIIGILQIPNEIIPMIKEYLIYIFTGIAAAFLYNFFAGLLRAVGNSFVPLIFLGISTILNIILDILFVSVFMWGIKGAAIATVIAQYSAGIGILLYYLLACPELRISRRHMKWDSHILKDISGLSLLTCLQQSVMNFGILMVQGLVNSFGAAVMAAFAAAVKIDSFAYSPVQDFGNAFSTFIAQNYGAGKTKRIRKGIKSAAAATFFFCLFISALVWIFAKPLLTLFIAPDKTEILTVGVNYLHIEGAFYFGIGLLFLFYGYYRAVNKPWISVILTVISLGTRVALAYLLSAVPAIGVSGIWAAIPAGWILADIIGAIFLRKR